MSEMRGPLAAFGALWLIACGASSPRAEEPAPSPEPTVIAAPLAALLPGGAGSVAIARPDELAGQPAVDRWVDEVLTAEALERIEIRTGIHPAELSELVRADFGEGRVVWLVRGVEAPRDLVLAAEMRMNTVAERSDGPLRRSGFIGTRRSTWVALSDDTLLVAAGHAEAEVAAIVRASEPVCAPRSSVEGSPEDLPWAVDGLPQPTTGGYFLANCLALHRAHRASPLLLLVPEPLDLPLDTGVGMLLARQEQLAATVDPDGDDLRVRVALTGEFPPGIEENVEQLFGSIATSDLGHALGLSDARDTFVVEGSAAAVHAEVRWPAAGLAEGLELIFAEDPWALIEGG